MPRAFLDFSLPRTKFQVFVFEKYPYLNRIWSEDEGTIILSIHLLDIRTSHVSLTDTRSNHSAKSIEFAAQRSLTICMLPWLYASSFLCFQSPFPFALSVTLPVAVPIPFPHIPSKITRKHENHTVQPSTPIESHTNPNKKNPLLFLFCCCPFGATTLKLSNPCTTKPM